MGYRITQDERKIIDSLLDKMPFDGSKFSFFDLHSIHVLKPMYPRPDGATDLAKYGAAQIEYRNNRTYEHIYDFMLSWNFAVKTDKAEHLMLTPDGEILRAYGSIEKYQNSFTKSDKQVIVDRISSLIEKIPNYGEFIVEYFLPNTIVFDAKDFIGLSEEAAIKRRDDLLEQKEELIKIHETKLKDEESLQYLVDNGFAFNRHDIKVEGKIYRQLTDKGRELKEYGSIEEYNRIQKLKEDKIISDIAKQAMEAQRNDNEYLRNKYQFWVTVSIGVSTGLAALYYMLEVLRIQYHLGLPHHVFFP